MASIQRGWSWKVSGGSGSNWNQSLIAPETECGSNCGHALPETLKYTGKSSICLRLFRLFGYLIIEDRGIVLVERLADARDLGRAARDAEDALCPERWTRIGRSA